jgi:hypothetical protein
MRLDFPTKDEAQAMADKIHEWMIANDAAYAQSVKDGHTKAWAIPYQDKDEDNKIISPAWFVNVKERSVNSLSAAEEATARSK